MRLKNVPLHGKNKKKTDFVHFLFFVNALRNLLVFDSGGRYKATSTNTLI